MKKIEKKSVILMIISCLAINVMAFEKGEKGVKFNVSGDIVSSYVWRGSYNAGASIQPTIGLSVGGFSFTAWGTTSFTGQLYKEVDLTAAYTVKGFTLSVADFWWGSEGAYRYFQFNNHATNHLYEGSLGYTFGQKCPININWNTIFGGNDKDARGDQNYSTYVEASYPFEIKGIGLTALVGVSPWKSAIYGTSGFGVCNVGFGASKELKITDSFSLPIYAKLSWNPAREDVNFVFGITLK